MSDYDEDHTSIQDERRKRERQIVLRLVALAVIYAMGWRGIATLLLVVWGLTIVWGWASRFIAKRREIRKNKKFMKRELVPFNLTEEEMEALAAQEREWEESEEETEQQEAVR